MRSITHGPSAFRRTCWRCVGTLLLAAPAAAQTGGAARPPRPPRPPPPAGARRQAEENGLAIAPADAPVEVQNAIAAANRIRKKPYIYGGGHRASTTKGYDCSGAVSYVLNAAGVLSSPLPSGPLMNWGLPGKGTWISVYANGGHAYAVIAGLRWDTSAVDERSTTAAAPAGARPSARQPGLRRSPRAPGLSEAHPPPTSVRWLTRFRSGDRAT